MSRYLLLLLLASAFAQEDLVDGFTREQYESLEKTSEKHEFQAEVANLLDIIINSLYMNKEVFLRELISNASDAMDKIRFLALQNPEISTADMDIRVEFDAEAKTLSISDKGVGMTKKDLVEKLGTVAKSGTTQFIEAIASGANMNLIGQFGVGFYSSFLVSDKVTVASKHEDDEQHLWISQAGHSFTVAKDPRAAEQRGTTVTLHMKQDAEEFLEEEKLKDIIKKYSEFIDYPIFLKVMREREVDEPMSEEEIKAAKDLKRQEKEIERKKKAEEAAAKAAEEKPAEGEEKPAEGEEKPAEGEAKPAETPEESAEEEIQDPEGGWMKKVKKSMPEWEKINAQKAIWLNDKKENSLEDYTKLFKTINKDGSEPLYFTHFSGEGEIEFKAIIFFPQNPPTDLFENYYQKHSGIRVYVRRVLISEEYENLMPKYLNFLKGVVHSDDMPLNVSRESLQHQRIIQMISKKAVKKVLDVLANLAEGKEEVDYPDVTQEEIDAITDDEKLKKEKEEQRRVTMIWNRTKGKERYNEFWKDFGKNIKLGIIEDSNNRNRLAKLLRFYTTKSIDTLTSFDEYISRMPESQEHIYFIGGESKEALLSSPHIQKLKQLDYEVIVLDDALEEYSFSYLEDYDKKKLKNVTKGELDLGNETEKDKKKLNQFKELYKPLTSWWKSVLDKEVEKVTVSKRLSADPLLISTGEYGYTANMERISRSQAYANTAKFPENMAAKKILEINPGHPMIKKMLKRVEDDPDDQKLKDYAMLLYQTALLNSGFSLKEDVEFGTRLQRIIRTRLEISASEPVFTPEVEIDEEEGSGKQEENVEQESLDEPPAPEETPESLDTEEIPAEGEKKKEDL